MSTLSLGRSKIYSFWGVSRGSRHFVRAQVRLRYREYSSRQPVVSRMDNGDGIWCLDVATGRLT